MTYFRAREDADYSWEDDGYRGHSHVIVAESDDGRLVASRYVNWNPEYDDPDEIVTWCEELAEDMAPRARDVMAESKEND